MSSLGTGLNSPSSASSPWQGQEQEWARAEVEEEAPQQARAEVEEEAPRGVRCLAEG